MKMRLAVVATVLSAVYAPVAIAAHYSGTHWVKGSGALSTPIYDNTSTTVPNWGGSCSLGLPKAYVLLSVFASPLDLFAAGTSETPVHTILPDGYITAPQQNPRLAHDKPTPPPFPVC